MNNLEQRQAEMRRERKQRKLKKRYGMTKKAMENLVKSLEKQIKETDDPVLKARLTGQLTRVLTVKPEVRAKRSKDFPTKAGQLSKRVKTGSMVDQLSDAEWLRWDMVVTIEKLRREQRIKLGRDLTQDEKTLIKLEVLENFSEEEIAAVIALREVIA